MSRLGIDRSSGLIYEGRECPAYPSWPTPMVSQTTLIEAPADLKKIPHSFDSQPFTWMFREDSFDPVSRIRRGRLFQKLGNQGWETIQVEAHPAIFSEIRAIADKPSKSLSAYVECTELLNKANRGEGMRLAIGVASAYSLWRIVQTEYSVNRDILVTLRSESAFGILPDIDTSKIHPRNLPGVGSAIDRVLNAAYRELPSSVVDQCRNAATVIISRWVHQQTNNSTPAERDLGSWIKVIQESFKEKVALCSALVIINRLHPRGKDNELVQRDLRQITKDDAELAVHAIGFIIREIGWDRNS